MELIRTLPLLPTAVHVPMRLMQLYRSPNSPALDAFAEVLVADAALSSKVLELANSSWFSRTRTVTRVSDALRLIGLNNVLPMLFGLSLAGLFNKANLPPEIRSALWRTSLLKAVIAREWLRRAEGSEFQEEAFLCGALQDIALPVLIAGDRSASMELCGILDAPDGSRAEREQTLFGADHAAFGAAIAEHMQLPQLYIDAIGTHHAPMGPSLPKSHDHLRTALRLSAAVPHGMTRLDDRSAQRLAQVLMTVDASADSTQLTAFIDQVIERSREMLALLTPADSEATNMKTFLQEVSDVIAQTMRQAIGHANRTIEQLQEVQDELEQRVRQLDEQVMQAEYDELTNVLSRRGFFTRGQNLMGLARKLKMACAVGFIDMDDFKSINDLHGHNVGDQALIRLADAMRGMIQNRGVLGRCGGDEFAFVLVVPAETGREAISAEVEQAANNLIVMTSAGAVPIAASAGITWLGVPDESHKIEDALKLADEQMYAIKRSRRHAPAGRAA